MSYTPVTPTLSSTTGYLVDVRDQVINFLRFLIYNPGFTSSIWESSMVSFRNLSAEYQNSSTELANVVKTKIRTNLVKRFRDHSFDVTITPSNTGSNDLEVVYSLSFDIYITNNNTGVTEPAIISGSITVDPDTNAIKLNYNQNLDTASI